MKEDIIKMVRTSVLYGTFDSIAFEAAIKKLEAVAAAAEREECARLCEDKHHTWRWDDEPDSASGPRDCAAAIRARGQA